jgi:predicted  nucleic acid-binding Zn-ribbon protein
MPERLVVCPICNATEAVKEFYIPSLKKMSHLSDKSSRGKVSSSSQIYLISGCIKCGATKKQINDYYKKGQERTHDERLERLRQRGLPLTIDSQRIEKEEAKNEQ